jgi:hypothetical protein
MHYVDAHKATDYLRVRSESEVQCSLAPEQEEHPDHGA